MKRVLPFILLLSLAGCAHLGERILVGAPTVMEPVISAVRNCDVPGVRITGTERYDSEPTVRVHLPAVWIRSRPGEARTCMEEWITSHPDQRRSEDFIIRAG
jgi:hypothetical protein